MAEVATASSSVNSVHSPAHLWIGPSDNGLAKVIGHLQRKFCGNGGCKTCVQCRMVTEQQHPAIMWFYPEKNYTREQFAPLFEQISLQLNEGDQFYFVIEKADFLSPAVANSLLKSLEEPPAGYYFLLIAERSHLIVPTIRSRCIMHRVAGAGSGMSRHPLFDFFTSTTFHDPSIFLKTLDTSGITERESVELLDHLFAFWVQQYRTACNEEKESDSIQYALGTLEQAYQRLPMPGSSKLFWKNLYLQMKG